MCFNDTCDYSNVLHNISICVPLLMIEKQCKQSLEEGKICEVSYRFSTGVRKVVQKVELLIDI